jgi:hypothetical protein
VEKMLENNVGGPWTDSVIGYEKDGGERQE